MYTCANRVSGYRIHSDVFGEVPQTRRKYIIVALPASRAEEGDIHHLSSGTFAPYMHHHPPFRPSTTLPPVLPRLLRNSPPLLLSPSGLPLLRPAPQTAPRSIHASHQLKTGSFPSRGAAYGRHLARTDRRADPAAQRETSFWGVLVQGFKSV